MHSTAPSQSDSRTCSSCGTVNPAWRSECEKCGASLRKPGRSGYLHTHYRGQLLFPGLYGSALIVFGLVRFCQTSSQISELNTRSDTSLLFLISFFPLVISIILGVGLISLKNWARILTILWNFPALVSACTFITESTLWLKLLGLVQVIISIYAIYWLWTNPEYFQPAGRTAPPPLPLATPAALDRPAPRRRTALLAAAGAAAVVIIGLVAWLVWQGRNDPSSTADDRVSIYYPPTSVVLQAVAPTATVTPLPTPVPPSPEPMPEGTPIALPVPSRATVLVRKNGIDAIAFAPHLGELITAHCSEPGEGWQCKQSVITIWNEATGERFFEITEIEEQVFDLDWSPDGNWIAAAVCANRDENGTCQGGSLMAWDTATFSIYHYISDSAIQPYQVEFSPDNQYLAIAACESKVNNDCEQSRVLLLDAATGETIRSFSIDAGSIGRFHFSPDSKLLAVASTIGVTVWEVSSGDQFAGMRGGQDVEDLAWSLDGRLAMAVCSQRKDFLCTSMDVEVWSRDFRQVRQRFPVNLLHFRDMAWSSDGKWLTLSGCVDSECQQEEAGIWEVKTGRRIVAYDSTWQILFRPEMNRIALHMTDLSVHILETDQVIPKP